MRRNAGIIGAKHKITGSDPAASTTSGIYDMFDQHINSSVWPLVKKYISCTESTSTVVERGSTMTFTVVTEGFADGSTLYYTVNTVSGTTMDSADFSTGDVSGSFTLTSNSATLTFGLVAEQTPGDAESNVFKLEIRTGSTGGTIVLESGNVTVTDVISYGTDIRTDFYEISNRYVTISSNDYTGAWDVGEIQVDVGSIDARCYLVFKCNTSTTYFNDICVAAVQVLSDSDVIQETWNFADDTQSWETVTSRTNGSSSLLSSYLTPSDADALTYSTSFSNTTAKLGWTSNTGSNTTGMADGISATTPTLTVGNGTVSQTSGEYYIYGEVSGAARYSHVVARSPSRTWASGEKIRVVHNISIPSNMTSTVNVNDALWIGIY